MDENSRVRLLTLTVLALLTSSAWGRGRHAYYEVGTVRHFKVSHVTTVQVPPNLEMLRVYHGIPDPAAWSGGGFRPQRAVFSPASCQVRSEQAGPTWLWEFERPQFTEQTFESRFELDSADRRFRADEVDLAWSDFLPPAGKNTAPSGVAALAEEARHDTPLDSLRALSSWIARSSQYDASVPWDSADVGQTLLLGRGHCGHHANLYAAVLKIWGIPCRIVSGVRLSPSSEMWTEQNDWNRHVWIEVLLPEVGWVEVEPRTARDPFFQPAELIRNSGTQSQVSWGLKDCKWSLLESYVDRIVAR